jgi:hypothetical protein
VPNHIFSNEKKGFTNDGNSLESMILAVLGIRTQLFFNYQKCGLQYLDHNRRNSPYVAELVIPQWRYLKKYLFDWLNYP